MPNMFLTLKPRSFASQPRALCPSHTSSSRRRRRSNPKEPTRGQGGPSAPLRSAPFTRFHSLRTLRRLQPEVKQYAVAVHVSLLHIRSEGLFVQSHSLISLDVKAAQPRVGTHAVITSLYTRTTVVRGMRLLTGAEVEAMALITVGGDDEWTNGPNQRTNGPMMGDLN